MIDAFLSGKTQASVKSAPAGNPKGLSKRVVACLDVRANDQGDLVVTKGDQYDVERVGRRGVPTTRSGTWASRSSWRSGTLTREPTR